MKCPKCAQSQQRKAGLKCTSCGYEHVFDPKEHGVTDGKFLALLKRASRNETQYYTFNQLYAAYCRGRAGTIAAVVRHFLRPDGKVGVVVGSTGLVGAVVGVGLESAALVAGSVALGVLGLGLFFSGRGRIELEPERRVAADQAPLRRWVERWEAARGPIERLLRKPSLEHPPGQYREPDIYDYGFERILVVEHDLLVDLFVKNQLHTEQRALVISEHGYPKYLVARAREALQSRPDLPVVLLHDATPSGTAMKQRVLASGLLPITRHPVVDAGLFPKDARQLKSLEATVPEARRYEVPVDLLPYGALAAGLAGIAIAPSFLPGVGVLGPHPLPPGHPPHGSGLGTSSGLDLGELGTSALDSPDDGVGDDAGADPAAGGEGSGGADFGGADGGGDGDFG